MTNEIKYLKLHDNNVTQFTVKPYLSITQVPTPTYYLKTTVAYDTSCNISFQSKFKAMECVSVSTKRFNYIDSFKTRLRANDLSKFLVFT